MGPANALKGPGVKKGRRGNASITGMNSVTPHAVAYAAIQVSLRLASAFNPENCLQVTTSPQGHFAISSAAEWTQVDGAFDYKQFYWNIVEMCQGDDGSEILKFLNQ